MLTLPGFCFTTKHTQVKTGCVLKIAAVVTMWIFLTLYTNLHSLSARLQKTKLTHIHFRLKTQETYFCFFFLIVRHNANIYTSTVATRYIKPYTQLNLEYIPPCNSYSHYTSNVWEDMILHLHLQHLLPILLIILGYAFFCFHTCIFIYWRSRCLTDCLSSVTLRWHH